MGSDHPREVDALARDVRQLLARLDRPTLQLKPNSYEPSVAESLALAMLELDGIASEARAGNAPPPPFANDFLNRRLSKRLLDRFPGRKLPAEFERRLDDALERLANGHLAGSSGPTLKRLNGLLADLELALLQRLGPVDWTSSAEG